MYKKCHQISYQQHAVIRNRKLIAAALNYASFSELPDYGISAPKVNLDILIEKPFIIGLHGTSRDSKLWPQKHWIELAKSISSKNFKLLLPWSNEKELQRATEISEATSNTIVLPKYSLSQLAYLISNAQGAIGVDTGLSHLTAALNIPIIAIYTDTDPLLTGVMAGNYSPAANLGGIGIVPTSDEVLSAMKNIGILES
jgi:heptosyltransferase-1